MLKSNISAVILTKNEELTLKSAIKSVLFCKEIIVIDDFSTDNTLKIAKSFGVKVLKRRLNGDFSSQRNFGLSKATSDWVLFLDADEVVSSTLQKEIRNKVLNMKMSGYIVKRKDYWLGKTLHGGEWGNNSFLRLGQKGKGIWQRSVHETWLIQEKVSVLKNSIVHYPHPTVKSFLSHIAFQSSLHAQEISPKKNQFLFLRVILYPSGKFFVNFFLKSGYKDGVHGFIYSVFMTFHSFISWSSIFLNYEAKN